MNNKAVLISIRPEWCEKIASGEKTVEVRKTKPKLEPPFKCFIYCTKPSYNHEDFFVFDAGTEKYKAYYGGGKVIGEFICDRIEDITPAIEGKGFEKDTCIPLWKLMIYSKGGSIVYGWHISDLVVYEKPKILSEFEKCKDCGAYMKWHFLSRPPQSWCYVEEVEE